MFILIAQKFDIDRFLRWGIGSCALAAVVAMGWILSFFLGGALSDKDAANALKDKKMAHMAYLSPLDAIGSGPLALRTRIACGWVSRIAEEFSVIAFNSRPDALQKEAKILIAVREGKEQMTIRNGQIVFLQERAEGKGLSLTDASTALWVKPILLDNGNVLIESGRKLISKEGALIAEEKGEFIAYPVRSAHIGQEGQLSCLAELKAMRNLGQDPLIEKYGGKEYASYREKVRMECTADGHSYACFVSQGDCLQYKDREWRLVSHDNIDGSLPLARVISAGSKGIEIQAWDESGFSSIQVSIDANRAMAPPVAQEMLPNALRLRSATRASCILGKKRLILKKGDWILKTSAGWRNLKRSDEIEDCLYHRLKGELLIVDNIEKQQGKYMLNGYIFDKDRLNAALISLPIDSEKKGSQRSRKKTNK